MAKTKTEKPELSESAHRIWMAGLGALSVAEQEGGKVFRSLVSLGEGYAARMREPVGLATGRVRGTVHQMRSRASKALDQLEQAIDDRVHSALERVGVPSRKEIAALTKKVEHLARRIDDVATVSARPKRKKKPAAKAKATAGKTRARRKTAGSA